MIRLLIVLSCIGFLTLKTADSKLDTICHTWKWVGVRSHKGDYKPVNTEKDEILTLNGDGTYEKLLYGQLSIKGNWGFAKDSTELFFTISSFNGQNMPDHHLPMGKPTDSIILLTSDTLVVGHLAFFGPENEYGHDDWYYVRVAPEQAH
jgi:hypothetical protein